MLRKSKTTKRKTSAKKSSAAVKKKVSPPRQETTEKLIASDSDQEYLPIKRHAAENELKATTSTSEPSNPSLSATPPKPKKPCLDHAPSIFGVCGISPKTADRTKKIFAEKYREDSAGVYSPIFGNAIVTKTSTTGTPKKIQTTTPHKRELTAISTKLYREGKKFTFFMPAKEESGYDSDQTVDELKAKPNITTVVTTTTAVASLETVRARKKMARSSQAEVLGGSGDSLFLQHLSTLTHEALEQAPKAIAHLIAKAIGGDNEDPQRESNLKITTQRTNINMFIPERRITAALNAGSADEIHVEVVAEELYIDNQPTRIAVRIDYSIANGLAIIFNGLSITKLPYDLRRFMRSIVDDYLLTNGDAAIIENQADAPSSSPKTEDSSNDSPSPVQLEKKSPAPNEADLSCTTTTSSL